MTSRRKIPLVVAWEKKVGSQVEGRSDPRHGMRRHSRPVGGRTARSVRIACALFSLSFGTVLFALVMFRLVSFFIMPSLFFDLLFVVFPVGAFVGARFFSVHLGSFVRTLWLLLAVMVATVPAILLAKHFSYMRANFGEAEVPKLLGQIAVFTGLLFPFFGTYGLSEYVGYRVGRRYLGRQMRLVYGLYLFGAAAAYLALNWLPARIGMARILAVALGCTGLAIFAVQRGRWRILAGVEVLLTTVAVALPQLEGQFLSLYKGQDFGSTRQYEDRGCEMVFQEWGRYSLCEIMRSQDRKTCYGFYNDFFQWEYTLPDGFSWETLSPFPLKMVDPASRIAIIGAGGGRQVRFASRLGIRRIVAIEIEPAVLKAVRNMPSEFDGVYEKPEVLLLRTEGRQFLKSASDQFDLIYLPSVGGYPQMMLEPGNMIRTYEAYRTIMDRLADNGVLAIWYPWGLDRGGILTSQYVRTLRALGFQTRAYCNEYEYLILCRKGAVRLPSPERICAEIPSYPWMQGTGAEEARHVAAREYVVDDDPWFVPVTDDRPYLGGNIRNVLSIGQVLRLFGSGACILAIAGVVAILGLRRGGDPGIPGRSYWSVAGLAFLLGANFLLIEHYLVLGLFRRTYIYYDSLLLGAVSFLVLTGLGSLITTRRLRPVAAGAAAVAMVVLLAWSDQLPPTAVIALIAPVAVATGSFFPALFDLAARNPLAVFALDAIGAGCGALLAGLVPITLGMGVFMFLGGAVFLVTAAANALFHHRRPRSSAWASV